MNKTNESRGYSPRTGPVALASLLDSEAVKDRCSGVVGTC